ncbi:MAG: hypothetical protein JOS17DRAFT_453919 [Linnemannia elongata]|nr:MAG: hypothetical protein JOS17DRAFT_453919 [Linnemannia elongata]
MHAQTTHAPSLIIILLSFFPSFFPALTLSLALEHRTCSSSSSFDARGRIIKHQPWMKHKHTFISLSLSPLFVFLTLLDFFPFLPLSSFISFFAFLQSSSFFSTPLLIFTYHPHPQTSTDTAFTNKKSGQLA